jgi:hypothetical protein
MCDHILNRQPQEDAMKVRPYFILTSLVLSVIIAVGCQSTYYAVWEKMGKEKRHLLRDNVEKASEAQKKASEQFKDVLTQMKEMYGFDGVDL